MKTMMFVLIGLGMGGLASINVHADSTDNSTTVTTQQKQ